MGHCGRRYKRVEDSKRITVIIFENNTKQGKTMFKTLLLSTLLLLTPQFVMADAKPEILTHEKAISKIMELSGLSARIPEISKDVISSFNPYIQHYSKAKATKVSISVLEAFDKDVMHKSIKDEIAQNLSLEDALPIMSWYQSDIGREITRIEKIATNDQDVEALYAKKDKLFQNKERVSLSKEIERQAHIIDTLVNTQIEVMKSSLKVSQPTLDSKTINGYFDNMKKQVKGAIEEPTIISLLKAYESVDVEKMKLYIKFLSRATTQKFILSGNRGISNAIDRGTNIVSKMVSSFPKE